MSDIRELAKTIFAENTARIMPVLKVLQAKINRKGETSFFLLSIKGVAALLFLVGITGGLSQNDFNAIIPVHSATEEEVQVASLDAQERTTNTFVGSHLNAIEANKNSEDSGGVGGSIDPTMPTVQGSTLLSSTPITIPDEPDQDREEITKYIVKPGDTATGIANSFGISLSTLLWSNHFSSPHYIKPGEELLILPYDGVLYEVKTGDTISTIASKHKSEVDEILNANEINSPEHIFAGQTIIIPGGVKASTPRTTTQASAPRYSSQPAVSGYFIRPTSGRISQGLHLRNAVDVANSCWTPIVASASGTVNVASSGGYGRFSNGGYGGYVLINHPNGLRTLYAHMIQVEVSAGQYVSQGQIIGRMGGKPGTFGAGRSTGCHLHWEVHGARNPLAY